MTEKERTEKAREFRKLWKYSQKLKEGGKAWARTISKLEEIKKQLIN